MEEKEVLERSFSSISYVTSFRNTNQSAEDGKIAALSIAARYVTRKIHPSQPLVQTQNLKQTGFFISKLPSKPASSSPSHERLPLSTKTLGIRSSPHASPSLHHTGTASNLASSLLRFSLSESPWIHQTSLLLLRRLLMIIPLPILPLQPTLRLDESIRKPIAGVRPLARRIIALAGKVIAAWASAILSRFLAIVAALGVVVAPGVPPLTEAFDADGAAVAAVWDVLGLLFGAANGVSTGRCGSRWYFRRCLGQRKSWLVEKSITSLVDRRIVLSA